MGIQHCALITGASKGIGKAMAYELASRGVDILAVARTEPLLAELCADLKAKHGVQAHYKAMDLTAESAPAELCDWVEAEGFPVSMLINNAGYGLWGRFHQLDLADMRKMMFLNMDTMVSLTYAFLPLLRQREKAFILNVGSTAAYQAVPTLSVYSGTKAFVINFSRGLRHELSKTKVSVSCLSPGPTESEFTSRAGMQAMQDIADKFNMKADVVAKIAVKGMLRGKAEIVPGFMNKATYGFVKLMPKIFSEKFAANLYEKKLED